MKIELWLLFGFSVGAVCMDLYCGRISNVLIVFGLLAGIGLNGINHSLGGLGKAILGMLWSGGLLFILFWFHAIGGGDVKLFAVFGAFLGPEPIPAILFRSLVFGAFFSAGWMLRGGVFKKRMGRLYDYVKSSLLEGKIQSYPQEWAQGGQICFSPAMLLGLTLTLLLE